MFDWRRARKRAERGEIEYLESVYSQPPRERNFGILREKFDRITDCVPASIRCPHLLRAREGKSTILSPALFEAWPAWHWGLQGTGDCFEAGTMIQMANGTEKPIEAIVPGESVVTHTGAVRPVLDTIKKPFSGQLATIVAKGFDRELTATTDHRLVTYPGIGYGRGTHASHDDATPAWQSIGKLNQGDRVLLPYGHTTLRTRKQESHQRVPSGDVILHGESGLEVYPEHRERVETACVKRGTRKAYRDMTKWGLAAPIKSASAREVVNGTVYCLCVADDHSFIANGYAVHNCVGWGTAHMDDVNLAVAALAGKIRQPDAMVSSESIYGFGKSELFNSYGSHGAGMNGIDAVDACKKYGTLYRIRYPEYDLRNYNGDYAVAWGERPRQSHGVPDELEPYAAKHKAREYVQVDSIESGAALLEAGYSWQYCGYTYWPTRRTSDGMGKSFSSGWHCMTAVGVIYDDDGKPAWWRIANTGHGDHCEGPNEPGAVPAMYQECGGWVPNRLVEPVIRAGDCFCITFVEGWPVLDLPDLGWARWL